MLSDGAPGSSTAEDAVHDLPLRLEFFPNASTGTIEALPPAGDFDADGLTNADEADTHFSDPANPDTDGDTLPDGDEVNTHGTSPILADSDADGLDDGDELTFYGTDPIDPDTDADGYCDGPLNPGGACASGTGDNCPAVDNASQANSDAFGAGDACQCGDVTNDGALTAADADSVREHLVDKGPTPFFATRCNVVGPSDGGATDCNVADSAVIERAAAGAEVGELDLCNAYNGL